MTNVDSTKVPCLERSPIKKNSISWMTSVIRLRLPNLEQVHRMDERPYIRIYYFQYRHLLA